MYNGALSHHKYFSNETFREAAFTQSECSICVIFFTIAIHILIILLGDWNNNSVISFRDDLIDLFCESLRYSIMKVVI